MLSKGITLEGYWIELTIWQKREAKFSETVIVILVAAPNRVFESRPLLLTRVRIDSLGC